MVILFHLVSIHISFHVLILSKGNKWRTVIWINQTQNHQHLNKLCEKWSAVYKQSIRFIGYKYPHHKSEWLPQICRYLTNCQNSKYQNLNRITKFSCHGNQTIIFRQSLRICLQIIGEIIFFLSKVISWRILLVDFKTI